MPDYRSNKGQVMLAIQKTVKELQPPDIAEEEVQIRPDWLDSNGTPYRGVSIIDMGEQTDEGTCGTQDIGYIVGIVFAEMRTADAVLSDDKIMYWYEITRRRLIDQRLNTVIAGPAMPAEHVCIVMPGRTLTNPQKYPNYLIRQLVVAAWHRELPTT